MTKRTWKITGHDSTREIFSTEVPGMLTDNEIARMLERLASRHLTENEVVDASLRKNFVGYRPLLECHFEHAGAKGNMVWTEGNPYYTAFRERVI